MIVGDLPSATYNGVVVDDLLINAKSTAIDGVGGTLAALEVQLALLHVGEDLLVLG